VFINTHEIIAANPLKRTLAEMPMDDDSPGLRYAAHSNPLLGTWKLKSYVATTQAGEASTPYGAHPTGYLSYSADGRMHAIGIADGRAAALGADPTDAERATLWNTMFAYAGSYTLSANKVIHHVDISWNQVWTGTDQIRFYDLSGDTLVITASARNSLNGQESHFAITWQKVAGPP
jgi:hypothetical protein